MKYDTNDPRNFLNDLPISDVARQKLAELSPKSAFDLLSRRRAATQVFDAHVGLDEADAVAKALAATLTAQEREALAAPPAPRRRLGARMGKPDTSGTSGDAPDGL